MVSETPPAEAMPAARSREPGLAQIVESLRDRIARRELAPHARLQEQALAQEFGVPRVRIREALMALQQRGLVEREPNRSARVIRLDLRQVFEIFDVRESLEGLCVRLAVERTPPEMWQELVELYQGPMVRCVREGDLDSYFANIEYFRSRVIAAADNAVLADALDRIHDKARAIIKRISVLPGRMEQSLAEFQLMVAAMRRDNIRSQRAFVERYRTFVL